MVAVFQTRGRSLVDFLSPSNENSRHPHVDKQDDNDDGVTLHYPVDTVGYDGETVTEFVRVCAAGTLGSESGKKALKQLLLLLLDSQKWIRLIGVGVTEAGLSSADNQCMIDLTWVLYELYVKSNHDSGDKICIVNTDNVPNNGDVIRSHVLANAQLYEDQSIDSNMKNDCMSFSNFLKTRVAFLNSMVDRITSARKDSNGMIPSCEPLPEKALVICDPGGDLPDWMMDEGIQKKFGVRK